MDARKKKLEEAEANAAPLFARMPEGARERFKESADAHEVAVDARSEYQRSAKLVSGAPKRQQALAAAEAARVSGDRDGLREAVEKYASLLGSHTDGAGVEDSHINGLISGER